MKDDMGPQENYFISINSYEGKYWNSDMDASSTWDELLEEFIYGLRGMGFFISLEIQEKIMAACQRQGEHE